MKFGQIISYYKKKKIYQKILQKLRPVNYFQELLCFQRTKFLKQATNIRCVMAKLFKFVQINM